MQQSGKGVKRTLGQKTEDRLMKYILDKPVKIGERIPQTLFHSQNYLKYYIGYIKFLELKKEWTQVLDIRLKNSLQPR